MKIKLKVQVGLTENMKKPEKKIFFCTKKSEVFSATPILVSNRPYVESKHSGLSKVCLLVFPEILERAEKFGFLQTGF